MTGKTEQAAPRTRGANEPKCFAQAPFAASGRFVRYIRVIGVHHHYARDFVRVETVVDADV